MRPYQNGGCSLIGLEFVQPSSRKSILRPALDCRRVESGARGLIMHYKIEGPRRVRFDASAFMLPHWVSPRQEPVLLLIFLDTSPDYHRRSGVDLAYFQAR
jgi:hypothetical protein